MDELLREFARNLDQPLKDAIDSTLAGLSSAETAKRIFAGAGRWLPDDCVHQDTYQVYVYFDGYRGSFAERNALYLDLQYHAPALGSEEKTSELERIASHELHHMAYGRWLQKNDRSFTVPIIAGLRRYALGKFREIIVLEGTAEQTNVENRLTAYEHVYR